MARWLIEMNTPADRLATAERAKNALSEFLEPAFEAVEHEWSEKMIAAAASTDPRAEQIITRLATGVKAIRTVRKLIEAHVADGALAEAEMKRGAQIARMSDHKRSVVGV